jgi:hypothetical protein
VILAPKFYYCDVGIVNNLLRRSNIEIKSELFGKAFENWVYHELRCYNSYQGLRELIKDQPSIKKRIVVSLVDSSRLTEDGIEILNYQDFIKMLWQGKIL